SRPPGRARARPGPRTRDPAPRSPAVRRTRRNSRSAGSRSPRAEPCHLLFRAIARFYWIVEDELLGAVPRRPQARSLERRERLLDATVRVLERDGLASLTTNAVAREAGTSIGGLYEHYPNKEALLAGLLGRYRERLTAAVDAALALDDLGAAADAAVDGFYR